MEKKTLAILLSTPPQHPNLHTVVGLARQALADGGDVYLYLIDDGVYAMDDHGLHELTDRGMKLFICAYSAQRRGLPTQSQNEKLSFCGLVVLGDLINGCDRFLAFGGPAAASPPRVAA